MCNYVAMCLKKIMCGYMFTIKKADQRIYFHHLDSIVDEKTSQILYLNGE